MPTHTNLHTAVWPATRLGEALEAIARHSGLYTNTTKISTPITEPPTADAALAQWLDATAASLNIEAEAITVAYADVEQLIQRAAPTLLHIMLDNEPYFLAVVSGRRHTITVLDPAHNLRRLTVQEIRNVLCQPLEAPHTAEMDRLLDEVGVSTRRQTRARQTILAERLRGRMLKAGWLLRPQPGHNLRWQLKQARLPQHVLTFLTTYVVQYAIWLLSWWVIGRSALQGRLEIGWLLAWVLLLFTLIPFKLLTNHAQSQVAIRAGGLLKSRLLGGALKLAPEEIRHQGAGQFLGQVIEAEAVESLALSGGLLGIVALLELVIAASIILAGAGGLLQMGLLVGWLVITAVLGWRYFRHRQQWTQSRLSLTHDLLERMVAHRTRLAQEAPSQWHNGEDEALAAYFNRSQKMDGTTTQLTTLVPRGWLAVGLVGLLPAFATAGETTALAIGLGGLLLAYQAFQKLAPSLQYLAGAAIAWQEVQALFEAASRPQLQGSPIFATKLATSDEAAGNLIEAHRLTFRYRPDREPILRDCHLQIQPGDRLLLEGPSGGGKSTLANLLSGLRQPDSGLLLLNGLDQQTLGDTNWRQQVIAAPQFHENHVLASTFAFNLLMGSHWPPWPTDLAAAEIICRELGLGELLERMPAGLMQMVGETGWQLSHGERSRLFLARALLQNADLTILDESFAALDPKNMARALRCVLNRANALMVIAHP